MQLLITCWIEQFGSFILIKTVWVSQWLSYSKSIGYVIKAQVIYLSQYWLLARLCKRFQTATQNLFCAHLRYYISSEKNLLSWKLFLDWATVHHEKTCRDCSSLLSSLSYQELSAYAIYFYVKMKAWGTFFIPLMAFLW